MQAARAGDGIRARQHIEVGIPTHIQRSPIPLKGGRGALRARSCQREGSACGAVYDAALIGGVRGIEGITLPRLRPKGLGRAQIHLVVLDGRLGQ